MAVSRGLVLMSTASKLLSRPKSSLMQVRHSGGGQWMYRQPKPKPVWGTEDFKFTVLAEIYGGFMWWWILYHCYHHPERLIGEWDIPDPEKWTNEELGIPATLQN